MSEAMVKRQAATVSEDIVPCARRMNVETQVVNPFERVPVQPNAAGDLSIDEAAPMLLLPLGLALRA